MAGKSHKRSLYTEILEPIDLFSTPIHLTLHKKRVLSSCLGGVLTIVLVIIICYQIGSQFVNMFNRKDPQIYQITELEDTPSILTLNSNSNFFLAVLITVDSALINITEASPFNFPTNYVKYRRDNNGTLKIYKHPILWAPCNEKDFPDNVYGKDTYNVVNLKYGYCASGINYLDTSSAVCPEEIVKEYPDCIAPASFEIKGTYTSTEFDFIQSNMRICDQDDLTLPDGMICSTENITQKFRTSQYEVDLFFANVALNSGNYETPNITFVEDVYWKLNPSIYKVSDIFVDKVIIEDSDDYISTSNQKNRSYYMIDSDGMRELERIQTTIGVNILQWNLRRSSKNLVIARTYTKVMDVLADLGGFSKAAMFVCTFLAIGYVRYKYLILVANELYDFEAIPKGPKKPPNMESAKSDKTLFSFEFNETNPFNILEPPMISTRQTEMKTKEYTDNRHIVEYFEERKRREKLDDSEWVYLKAMIRMVCCNKDPRVNLIMKAKALATKELDLTRTIKKLSEVDMLKVLVLNNNQAAVLEFCNDPGLLMNGKIAQNIRKIKRPPADDISLIASLVLLNKKLEEVELEGVENKTQEEVKSQAKLKSKIQDKILHIKAMSVTDPEELLEPRYRGKSNVAKEDFSSLSRYGRLYVAYRHLKEDKNPENRVLNRKLLATLDPKLLKVFRRIDRILGKHYTGRQFEEVLKNILEPSTSGSCSTGGMLLITSHS